MADHAGYRPMTLIAKRKLWESWREAVARRAGPDDPAPLAGFDALVAAGASDVEAAYRSLAAAGLLWNADEPGRDLREGGTAREVPPL